MSKFLSQIDLEEAFYRFRPPVNPIWRDADFADLRKLAEFESWKAKQLMAECMEVANAVPDTALLPG